MLGPRQTAFVEALRSGRYEQGKTFLCNCNKYCCLGVASEISAELGLDIVVMNKGDTKHFDNQCTYLPRSVMDFYGFHNQFGHIKGEDRSLSHLNDYENYNFEMIADYIEKNADKVFTQPL